MHLGARMLDVVFRPLHRPVIMRIKLAKSDPVAQGDFRRIRDFLLRLQGRVDQGHPAEGPQGKATEALGRIAIHQDHPFAATQDFQRGDDASQTATDDQNVRCFRRHAWPRL